MSRTAFRITKVKNLASLPHHCGQTNQTAADVSHLPLPHEYVNLNGRPLADLLHERLQECTANQKLRAYAVRCLDIVLYEIPESGALHRRTEAELVADRGSTQWVADVAAFTQQYWGGNLLQLTLHHQDDRPYFQACVVPVTADGRLSSREFCARKALAQLHNDLAKATRKQL